MRTESIIIILSIGFSLGVVLGMILIINTSPFISKIFSVNLSFWELTVLLSLMLISLLYICIVSNKIYDSILHNDFYIDNEYTVNVFCIMILGGVVCSLYLSTIFENNLFYIALTTIVLSIYCAIIFIFSTLNFIPSNSIGLKYINYFLTITIIMTIICFSIYDSFCGKELKFTKIIKIAILPLFIYIYDKRICRKILMTDKTNNIDYAVMVYLDLMDFMIMIMKFFTKIKENIKNLIYLLYDINE